MKSNFRRIAPYLVTALLASVIPTVSLSAAQAALPDTAHLTVHYQRTSSDYKDWNVYLWKDLPGSSSDKEISAAGVAFTGQDDFGVIAKVDITALSTFDQVGIIIRRGNWLEKEGGIDRFINTFDSNGNAEVWIRQGDKTIYTAPPTAPIPPNAAVIQAKLFDSAEFAAKYTYNGNDLGNTYSKSATKFRVWAPTATSVSLLTFPSLTASGIEAKETPMVADVNGTWTATVSGDQNGLSYLYRVTVEGAVNDVVDPYVRATTINGIRGVVVDLSQTNPAGWSSTKPKFSGNPTDASIYELHVRDLSIDPSSGVPAAHQGKYLAFTDTATSYKGVPTGIAHIKSLGVTHVELLPIFDYQSVDESSPTFNWGYDPQNFNVPEGSYSTDPTKPTTRIIELKSAIQSMHNLGLRVIMDVVYHHVYNASTYSESLIVPGYFFRTDASGDLTNGSGVGNDVADERSMAAKFITDSFKYWATEYHLDGFRIDQMGQMSIGTVNQARKDLTAIDSSILMLGEGWYGQSSLSATNAATQANIAQLPGVAAFNDQIRDGAKGSVFSETDKGFVSGAFVKALDVKAGIVGNTTYNGALSNAWTTASPSQSINYVESHDNQTIFDKLTSSAIGASAATLVKMDQMTAALVYLSQGVPFIQAGQEFLRSKGGNGNSYNSSDAVNSLKWSTLPTNMVTNNYYKGLLAIRKAHPAFRLSTSAAIKSNLAFLPTLDGAIAFTLDGTKSKDSWKKIVVGFNATTAPQSLTLPASGKWNVVVNGSVAGTKVLAVVKGAKVTIPAQTSIVLEQ
ncbi:MAG: type I pullulanase [Actinomycetes bacterium]